MANVMLTPDNFENLLDILDDKLHGNDERLCPVVDEFGGFDFAKIEVGDDDTYASFYCADVADLIEVRFAYTGPAFQKSASQLEVHPAFYEALATTLLEWGRSQSTAPDPLDPIGAFRRLAEAAGTPADELRAALKIKAVEGKSPLAHLRDMVRASETTQDHCSGHFLDLLEAAGAWIETEYLNAQCKSLVEEGQRLTTFDASGYVLLDGYVWEVHPEGAARREKFGVWLARQVESSIKYASN